MGAQPKVFGWRLMAVLAVAGALGWWMLSWEPDDRAVSSPDAVVEVEQRAPERSWFPRPRESTPDEGCAPRADRRCVEGDVWWIDGCDHPYAVAEHCDGARCREGACEPSHPGCGDETAPGRCDGDVARGCDAGHPFEIDCGRKGKRCVETESGPSCRTPTPEDCSGPAHSRCDGDHVVACIEGRWQRYDCGMQGGICATPPRSDGPRCVATVAPAGEEACGACGCPEEPSEERCDGRDNDGNGLVDDGVVCEPVDIIAFLIVDGQGKSSHARDDVEEEVERLHEWFHREDALGLEFRLADVIRVSAAEWNELDNEAVQAVFRSPTINAARESFYVPVVFTERIMMDEVPRPGLSSGPNGMCGGVRRTLDPQPPGGAVVLAQRRWPSTLAHEIGHFLGLCHTHADDVDVLRRFDQGSVDSFDEATACLQECRVDADGICDTPLDPGPNVCATDPECRAICADGASPDTSNVMAYYPECRTGFTEEQALTMRRMVALRRGWHACAVGDGCPCDPLAADCPEEMTCRSFLEGQQRIWRCDLDGASAPGGSCRGNLDCSRGTLCLTREDESSRCVRPCDPAEPSPGCDCHPLQDLGIGACMNDASA